MEMEIKEDEREVLQKKLKEIDIEKELIVQNDTKVRQQIADKIEPTNIKKVEIAQVNLDALLVEPEPNLELPKRKNLLIPDLIKLFCQNITPSSAIIIDDKKLYCHSLLVSVICTYSNYNCNQCLVANLNSYKISSSAFYNIYRWLMQPLTIITLPQLTELIHASALLHIEKLNTQCWELAKNSTDYVLPMYHHFKKLSFDIDERMFPHLGRVWLPFAASQEFANLDFINLRRLLLMDNLAVNTEIEVLYTAILWLDYDWAGRKRYALELAQNVHWMIIPSIFLITFDRRTDGPAALGYLTQSIRVRQWISAALQLICKNKKNKRAFDKHCRSWINDPRCLYHENEPYNKVRIVTYSQFMEYMKSLQQVDYSHSYRIQQQTAPPFVYS